VIPKILKGNVKAAIRWGMGLANESHSSLSRGVACLAAVARNAGANYIFPDVLTTSVARDDMV
jgi:hypothetical protein